ncbi:uncharacterized protein ACB058_014962 isoform 2-T2 [Synchiropus picturatus]
MEEEGPVNVKALRAKFQEEALNAQSKTSRPVVAEKPKHLPPPVAENKTPRIMIRDGLRASGGKRPNSFPPQPQKSPTFKGRSPSEKTLKDHPVPLIFPVQPPKPDVARHPVTEPAKDVLPSTKIKKKTLLLPFKSSKASKIYPESFDEPTYADLTTRPSSAPCELPSVEKSTDDDVYLHGDESTRDYPPSSPDVPLTPPAVDTNCDSDNKFLSTLERAKKKFSRRNMLISSKSKNVRSPDLSSSARGFPSPPPSIRDLPTPPPPVSLPHIACISARPFFKADNSARKLDKTCGWNKPGPPPVETEKAAVLLPPSKKCLPELRNLRQAPVKPPRPPTVDLSRFHPPKDKEVFPSPSQVPPEEPEPPSISSSVLVPPEFPDFENSEPENAEGGIIDIAGLELEAMDFVSLTCPPPNDLSDFEDQPSDFCDSVEPAASSTIQDLNLGSPNIIPLDPSNFPEPVNLPESMETCEWSHSNDAITFPPVNPDETALSAVDCHSSQEEAELSSHAALSEESQSYSHSQQDDYYEACDNVYEDVENINKFLQSQHLRKLKSVKNPYAENPPVKEEVCLNVWPRNPWGPVVGEHVHTSLNLTKEQQSPNTADYKENKKKEKQRLEREKKEQKEKEKKENEMKKKFKVTGEEEPMYHAKVMVANKVRKNDLPVKSGDTVSIIRTTNCPKGKWLARDANHKYGYISVMNVELNIKEMLELGKKAQAAGRGGNPDPDTISIGSRSSSHPVLTSSFTDDSEEWACEDETLSASNESHSFPQQVSSMPETSCGIHNGAQHTLSDANLEDLHTQTRHEALQKLAIFFQHGKNDFNDIPDGEGATPTNVDPPSESCLIFCHDFASFSDAVSLNIDFLSDVEEPPYPDQEVDFTELELLPPPPLYADSF